MARDLPLFDSVWIDALAQARLLTPFQAREINAGRGEQLLVGPYVLRRRVQYLGPADCFLAAEIDTDEPADSKSRRRNRPVVHLMVAGGFDPSNAAKHAAKLQAAAAKFSATAMRGVLALRKAGADNDRVWAAYDPPSGSPASEWLSCQGRFSPDAAIEIARQLLAELVSLEQQGIAPGDLAASALWLTGAGEVQLARCGWHVAIECEQESVIGSNSIGVFDQANGDRSHLLDGNNPPTTNARDVYDFGVLCWHLLAGRSPFVDKTAATRLTDANDRRISDIRHIAPDVSKILASAIEQCTHRDPAQRPQSFAELHVILGPSTTAGRRLLALELFRTGQATSRGDWPRKIQSAVQGAGQPLMAATACAVLLAAATWPFWRSRHPAVEPRNGAAPTATIITDRRVPTVENGLAIFRPKDPATNLHPAAHDRADHDVRPASFQAHSDAAPTEDSPPTSLPHRSVVELTDTAEIAGGTLRLQPGAIVRGKEGLRPRILVPPNGLTVTADQVRFENVDFIWRPRPEEITSPERHALLELKSGVSEFAGCTFQAQAVDSFALPAAIRLGNNLQRGAALAPAMRVDLERCVIDGVACGIDCAARGPVAIAARNSLYVGQGPLVQFSQPCRVDAATSVTLAHVTLRNARAAIELDRRWRFKRHRPG